MLVNLPTRQIEFAIPNLVNDATVIKRRAVFQKLIYDQEAKVVVLFFIVKHYAADQDDAFGEYLGSIIPDYVRKAVASNNTKCDLLTGVPQYPDELGEYSTDVAGQYDYFNWLGDHQPILVNQLIEEFGSQISDWSKN